jgi:protein-disulfide isomerase
MPSAKRMRQPEARRRYEARVAEVQKSARSRNLYLTALICSVVVLVSVIGIGVQATRAKIGGIIEAPFANATDGVIFGKKADATVDIYEDFACTRCRAFAQAVDSRLEKQVRANLAQVRYHPIAVLDSESPNDYSTRAASASLCASDQGDDPFITYHDTLYGTLGGKPVQPAPGQPGPTNSKLVALGAPMKLTSKNETQFRNCVTSGQYTALTQQMTDVASKRGIAGPFAVYVNASRLSDPTVTSLFAAIAAADKNGPPPQPSKTPTTPPPSSSPSGTPSTQPADSSPSGTPSSSSSAARRSPSSGRTHRSPSAKPSR